MLSLRRKLLKSVWFLSYEDFLDKPFVLLSSLLHHLLFFFMVFIILSYNLLYQIFLFLSTYLIHVLCGRSSTFIHRLNLFIKIVERPQSTKDICINTMCQTNRILHTYIGIWVDNLQAQGPHFYKLVLHILDILY